MPTEIIDAFRAEKNVIRKPAQKRFRALLKPWLPNGVISS